MPTCVLCTVPTYVPHGVKLCLHHRNSFGPCRECGAIMALSTGSCFCGDCVIQAEGVCDRCHLLMKKGEGKIITSHRHAEGARHLCAACQKAMLPLLFLNHDQPSKPLVTWDEVLS